MADWFAPSRVGGRLAVPGEQLVEFAAWSLAMARQAAERGPAAVRHLHGLTLHLHTANARYAELVTTRLVSREPAGGAACQVVVAAPEDSRIAPPPALSDTVSSRRLETILAPTSFRAAYSHDFHSWQICDIGSGLGLQWMTGPNVYPPWEPAAPLRVFLHWLYSARGMRLSHGGTLGRNGEGVLLAGKGGSGKSQTVVGGLLAGLQSVGDDYVLIDPRGEEVIAYPVFATLKQDEDGLRRLGIADRITARGAPNWQGKHEFGCAEIGGEDLADFLRIRAILIPSIAHRERTEIAPLPKAQAMLGLAPSSLFQTPGERDSGLLFFRRLVERLPCFRIALGNDPREISVTLTTFLDGLPRG